MIVAVLVEKLQHFLKSFGAHIEINNVSPRPVDAGDVPLRPRSKHVICMIGVRPVHFCEFGTGQTTNPSRGEVPPFGTRNSATYDRTAQSKYQAHLEAPKSGTALHNNQTAVSDWRLSDCW